VRSCQSRIAFLIDKIEGYFNKPNMAVRDRQDRRFRRSTSSGNPIGQSLDRALRIASRWPPFPGGGITGILVCRRRMRVRACSFQQESKGWAQMAVAPICQRIGKLLMKQVSEQCDSAKESQSLAQRNCNSCSFTFRSGTYPM